MVSAGEILEEKRGHLRHIDGKLVWKAVMEYSPHSRISRDSRYHDINRIFLVGRLLLTALNLLPSMATPASAKRPIVRHSTTNRLQTWRMARPLSLRKSAIVS